MKIPKMPRRPLNFLEWEALPDFVVLVLGNGEPPSGCVIPLPPTYRRAYSLWDNYAPRNAQIMVRVYPNSRAYHRDFVWGKATSEEIAIWQDQIANKLKRGDSTYIP